MNENDKYIKCYMHGMFYSVKRMNILFKRQCHVFKNLAPQATHFPSFYKVCQKTPQNC